MNKHKLHTLIWVFIALTVQGCSKNQENTQMPEGTQIIVVLNNISETFSYFVPENRDTLIDVDTTGSAPNDILINGNYAYIVNSGFGGVPSIMKIDLSRDSVVGSFIFPDGSNPWGIAKENEMLFVTCTGTNKLYEFDEYLRLIDTVTVGKSPEWLTAYNGKIYIAATGYDFSNYTFHKGAIIVVENGPNGLSVTDSFYSGINTQDVAIYNGKLFALASGDYASIKGKIFIYGINDFTVTMEDSIEVGNNPGYMYIYHGYIYLADFSAGIAKVDPENKEVIWQNLGNGASRILMDSNGNGYLTKFSSNDANYIIVFDPERLSIMDSVYMGTAKGIQGLGVWLKIH